MNTPKPLAYSYRRFSHIQQNEEGSLKRQKDIAVEYCRKHDLQLVDDEQYVFLDRAKSAYRGKNATDDKAELRRFLDLVEAKSIPVGSYLIVESLDRLSRQHPREALPRFLDLLNAGIHIVSVNDDKLYKAGEVQELDLIVSIMEMSRSHRESHHKSVRVGIAWRNKQEAARSGKPMGATKPGWLDAVYDDNDKSLKKKPTHYVVNEAKANIVRDIFQMTLDGYGRNIVARKLNERGTPAFRGKTGWGASSVDQILKSPTVLGIYQPYRGKGKERVPVGEPITGLYAPIIDETTFYAAQKATTDRFRARSTKQPPRFNVWSKLLKCTHCRAALNLYSKGKEQRKYLRCYEAAKGRCQAKAIRLDRSEEVFKELLTKVNSLSLVQSDARSLQAQLNELEGRIAVLQRDMTENLEFLRARPSPAIRALVADADDEIARLEEKRVELEKALAADRITDKADFFARLDLESYEGRSRANELLQRLSILVTASKVDIVTTYLVYKKELEILTIKETDGNIHKETDSPDVMTAMFYQGEVKAEDLFVSGRRRKLRKPNDTTQPVTPASTAPGPDWSQYEEPDWYTVTNSVPDEYTVTRDDESPAG